MLNEQIFEPNFQNSESIKQELGIIEFHHYQYYLETEFQFWDRDSQVSTNSDHTINLSGHLVFGDDS